MSACGWVDWEGGEWGSTLFDALRFWVELFGRRGGGFLGCSVWICMDGVVVSGLMGGAFANARSVGAGGVVWGIVSFWTGSYE
jgi:hypothetical protein